MLSSCLTIFHAPWFRYTRCSYLSVVTKTEKDSAVQLEGFVTDYLVFNVKVLHLIPSQVWDKSDKRSNQLHIMEKEKQNFGKHQRVVQILHNSAYTSK